MKACTETCWQQNAYIFGQGPYKEEGEGQSWSPSSCDFCMLDPFGWQNGLGCVGVVWELHGDYLPENLAGSRCL